LRGCGWRSRDARRRRRTCRRGGLRCFALSCRGRWERIAIATTGEQQNRENEECGKANHVYSLRSRSAGCRPSKVGGVLMLSGRVLACPPFPVVRSLANLAA
jgi:hypothetical protein